MDRYFLIIVNGGTWSAYQTNAKRAERRWSFQHVEGRNLTGVVAFYKPTIDAALDFLKPAR